MHVRGLTTYLWPADLLGPNPIWSPEPGVTYVAVVGSRDFTDEERLERELDLDWRILGPAVLVSGGARGADRLAERWAKKRGIPAVIINAEWEPDGKFNPKAGFERNTLVVDVATWVISYWDGFSSGTGDTIEKAIAQGKWFDDRRFIVNLQPAKNTAQATLDLEIA